MKRLLAFYLIEYFPSLFRLEQFDSGQGLAMDKV